MNRRHLLVLAAGSAATSLVVTAGPGVVALVAPREGEGAVAHWVPTVPIASLREGEKKRVAIVADVRDAWTRSPHEELGSVWLVRKGDLVVAFSAVCPHLGCAVSGKARGFVCLCHDSHFSESGEAEHGPSPRGLDPLATRVEQGVVHVDFRRFRAGSRDRIEVG